MSPPEPKAKRSRPHGQRGGRRSRARVVWWVGGLIVLVALAVGVWGVASRDQQGPRGAGLPGPIGGRDISQEVNTLIGVPAPSFTLATASGERHTVPGDSRRPTLIIFHMGLG